MVVFWKVFLTILILYTIAIDGNRARRRRRQGPMMNPNPMVNSMHQQQLPPNPMANSINQQQLPPNPQILNRPGQPSLQQGGPNDLGISKGGRQYYSPYGQYGSGGVQGLNYPYAGAGLGSYQYGSSPYGQYGQYGSYGNQYPGTGYSGYNSGGYYNNPGYSNYYPSAGGNYYGGYFWNAGQKQNINIFTVFLSSLLTLVICLITV